jgi:hypothetical protein
MVKPNNGRGKSVRRARTLSPYSLKWYQVKITSWDFSWSFRMATRREVSSGEDAIQECAVLTFKGTVVYPEEFKYSGDSGSIGGRICLHSQRICYSKYWLNERKWSIALGLRLSSCGTDKDIGVRCTSRAGR